MSTKNLSSVATAVILSYGNTAINMINAYRVGGERVIGFVDQRFEAAVGHRRRAPERRTAHQPDRHRKAYQRLLRQGPANRHRPRRKRRQHGRWNWPTRAWIASPPTPSVSTKRPSWARWRRSTAWCCPWPTAMSEVVVRIEEGSSQLANKVAGKPAIVKAAAKQAKTVKKAVAKTGEEGRRHQEGVSCARPPWPRARPALPWRKAAACGLIAHAA